MRKIQEFARYEFKYIITNSISNAIETEVKNFMQSDSFASLEKNNAYYVRSQYYDNDLSSHFYTSIDDLNKNRASISLKKLQELNPNTSVSCITCESLVVSCN